MHIDNFIELAFGGGCHWCTEAVFQSLKGVFGVRQGWISHTGEEKDFSEAVLIKFNPEIISMEMLIKIHLDTHSSASNHAMRKKYRSAVYALSSESSNAVGHILTKCIKHYKKDICTQVLIMTKFKQNVEYQNYYYTNPKREFCKRYIKPKLQLVMNQYAEYAKHDKISAAIAEQR